MTDGYSAACLLHRTWLLIAGTVFEIHHYTVGKFIDRDGGEDTRLLIGSLLSIVWYYNSAFIGLSVKLGQPIAYSQNQKYCATKMCDNHMIIIPAFMESTQILL